MSSSRYDQLRLSSELKLVSTMSRVACSSVLMV